MRDCAWATTLFLFLGTTSACQFERRPDLAGELVTEAPLALPSTTLEDSVRMTVEAMIDAFAASDSALVVALTTPDAVLIDHAGGLRWTRAAGGLLPGPLPDPGNGLTWSVEDLAVASFTNGLVLLSSRFTVPDAAEDVLSSTVETWLVIRTDGGWRVHYLHRSQGAGRNGPAP